MTAAGLVLVSDAGNNDVRTLSPCESPCLIAPPGGVYVPVSQQSATQGTQLLWLLLLLVLIPLVPALAWLYAYAGRNRVPPSNDEAIPEKVEQAEAAGV